MMYPWVTSVEQIGDTTHAEGILIQMLESLAVFLNFRYVFLTDDWGQKLPNGTWSGFEGSLLSGDLDLVLGPWLLNAENYQDLPLAHAFHMKSSFTLIASTGKSRPNNFFAFLFTFDSEIWMFLLLSFLVLLVFSAFLEATHGTSLPANVDKYFWLLLAALFLEGTPKKPSSRRGQFLLGLWLLSILTLMNAFSGQFKALLMVQQEEDAVKSIKDLAERKDKLPFIPDHESFLSCFRDSHLDEYRDVWRRTQERPGECILHPFRFVTQDFLQGLKDGEGVAVADDDVMKTFLANICTKLTGTRRMYLQPGACFPYYFGLAASSSLPPDFFKRIVTSTRRMFESYIFNRWVELASRDYWKCEVQDESSETSPLGLHHIAAVFYMLVFLGAISISVVCCEIITKKCSQ